MLGYSLLKDVIRKYVALNYLSFLMNTSGFIGYQMKNKILIDELRELASWNKAPRVKNALEMAADTIQELSASPYDCLTDEMNILKKDLEAILNHFDCEDCGGPTPKCKLTGLFHCARGKF
jgi:hypothetical protein